MKTKEELKSELIGLPKVEKLNFLQNKLNTRLLKANSHVPGSTGYTVSRQEKSPEEKKSFEEENKLLADLIEEIESNWEAYESEKNIHLIPFKYNRDFDWFYDVKNLPQQDLLFETMSYVEAKDQGGIFDPLEFINLFYCQYEFVKSYVSKPHSVLEHLKKIPVEETERQVLLGFIIKWFGGYPVQNNDPQYLTTLKLIEKQFLKFNENSPELFFYRDKTEIIKQSSKDGVNSRTKSKEVKGYRENSALVINEKKGSKIDLIRILYALHATRLITKNDGTLPSKKEFFKEFGDFLGTDLTKYSRDISQAVNTAGLESNLKIFEEMKNCIQKELFDKKTT